MFKCRLFIVCIAISLLIQCQPPLEGLDLLFPKPNFRKGWKWEKAPDHYIPENLYELINGEAELYHAYGFQELAVLTCYKASLEDSFFTAHIYDMGTPENAFGVYSSYRHPGYKFEIIGAEAMLSNFGVKFYKGPYFVDISYSDTAQSIQQAGLICARRIAENIPGPAEPPGVVRLLPSKGQVDKSLRYVAGQMLNQSFLSAGVEASYNWDEGQATGFVIFFDDPEKALSGFSRLKQFYNDAGLETEKLKGPEDSSFAVKTKYQGWLIAVQSNAYIVGARELQSVKKGFSLVQEILSGLD